MLAYKAFNKDLRATLGRGTFQYEPGKTYEEDSCKCANTGFHCAENPLGTLDYYSKMDTRFFLVKAEGDINQDGKGSRISCNKLTLVKELNRIEIAVHGCMYMQKYPNRENESKYVVSEKGRCDNKGNFIIVRGKHPAAAGVVGAYLFLIKEEKSSRDIATIEPILVDGEEYQANTYYCIRGGKVCKRKN
ncbi:MAG: hypothetical protein PHP50_10120 [Lachnospiraceae bacterium]|nr:hypothetical protein [Lachnospiraceae bacterium]